jgi:hypothetical protein
LTRPPQQLELSAVQDFYQSELHRFESHQENPYFVAGGGLLREWSFAESADGWIAQHQCSIEAKDGQLHITSNGNDPFVGTEVSGAAGQYLLTIRARTAAAGPGQIFWRTTQHPAEAAERSANFALLPGKWHVYQVPLTFSSDLVGLRLDPGAEEGLTTLDWIRISYGHTPVDVPAGANIDELAALTLVSRALMNLDEMITNP